MYLSGRLFQVARETFRVTKPVLVTMYLLSVLLVISRQWIRMVGSEPNKRNKIHLLY